MKYIKKSLLLLGLVSLSITSCENLEKKSFCLETCATPDYIPTQYYQASRDDIFETVYLVAAPLNPNKGDNEDYKYPITWNYPVNYEHFSFTDGLQNKKIKGVLKIRDDVVRINFDGALFNEQSKFGYIKVHYRAFTSHVSETRDAYLYAYVGLGDEPLMLDKDEYKSFCLQTSNSTTYTPGKCVQVSKTLKEKTDEQDAEFEKIYVFNNFSDQQYAIKWNDDIGQLDVMLLDGLRGKRVSQVTKINDNVIEVEIEKSVNKLDSAFGYIRIRNSAFTSDNEELKDKNLYACVAIGDSLDLVDVPIVD